MLIELLIFFKVAFIQGLLISSNNLVTSEKFLGSGMNSETFKYDSQKIGKACKISLTTALNNFVNLYPCFTLMIMLLYIMLDLI